MNKAKDRARKATCVIVDQRHLFERQEESYNSGIAARIDPGMPDRGFGNITHSAREAGSVELELDTAARRLSALAAEAKDAPEPTRISLSADILAGVLVIARETMRLLREKGRSEFQGAFAMDDETWRQEEFSELADIVESASMRLADISSLACGIVRCAHFLSEYRPCDSRDSHDSHPFPKYGVGWGASMEGALCSIGIRDGSRSS